MSFLPPKAPQHHCAKPPIERWFHRSLPQGTRWQCDECQEIWVVHPLAIRPTIGFWARENPKPPKSPSGGGIPTRRAW